MTVMIEKFEPKILMFACNWCAYSGLDLAGTSRMTYPTNVSVMRTMCSSRVDTSHILEAFKNGIDGVLIGACHKGDCHYVDGNLRTMRRVEMAKGLIDEFGLSHKRIRIEGIAASEGMKVTEVVTEMVQELKELGPIKFKEVA
ncbi:MAG: hydrogenase iron-sulfur subunit [Candidatus Kariarchaeaceae archaeon]|jgi:F420-non-reducing hydrogenase iron-sulfur subunit